MNKNNEYMTKDEYETFTRLQDKFYGCLEQCAKEIFVMQYKREPRGEFCGDCELYDAEQYMVQFETWSCGESDRDTTYVPISYMCDESFRRQYETCLEDRRRRQVAYREAEIKRSINVLAETKEKHDLSEYERLKKKYEVTE